MMGRGVLVVLLIAAALMLLWFGAPGLWRSTEASAVLQVSDPVADAGAQFALDEVRHVTAAQISSEVAAGQVQWRQPIASGRNCVLYMLGEDVVYEPWGGGTLTAYSPAGAVAWRLPSEGERTSPSAYWPSSIEVTEDGLVVILEDRFNEELIEGESVAEVLRAQTMAGQQLWQVPFVYDHHGQALLAVSDRFVYVFDWGDARDELSGVHAVLVFGHDGRFAFKFYTDHPGAESIRQLADGTTVYFSEDTLYAVDSLGSARWDTKIGKIHYAKPQISSDGTIYLMGTFEGELHAVSPDGKLKWSITPDRGGGQWPVGTMFPPSLGHDGTVYVALMNDVLCAISPEGKHIWQRIMGNIAAPPGVGDDGTVYVADGEEGLVALDPSGEVVWVERSLRDVNAVPVQGPNRMVYVINGNELYAVMPPTARPAKVAGDTALARFGAENSERVKWAYRTQSSAYNMYDPDFSDWNQTPLIATDGTVYVASPSEGIIALNPDGTLKWSRGEGESYWGWGAKPFVIDPQGQLYSLDCEYDVDDSGELLPGPAYLFALDPQGADLWKIELAELESRAELSFDAGMVLLNSGQSVVGYTPAGVECWRFSLGAGEMVYGLCVDDGGAAYCNLGKEKLVAIGPDGSKRWEHPGGSYFRPVAASGGGVLFLTIGDGLFAVGADGQQAWNYSWDQRYIGTSVPPAGGEYPAISADGTVYFGTSGGRLIALTATGEPLWQYQTDHVVSVPAVGPDGTVYATSFRRSIHALNPDGTVKWEENRLGFVDTAPAIGPDGTVYVGSDVKLYALQP